MVSALEGKTELFQKKVTKKGPKTGSGWITPLMVMSMFFREFPGFLKIQVEMPRAGKRGEAGAVGCGKNHSNLLLTCRHTLALGIPGSLKKRRLRRKNRSSKSARLSQENEARADCIRITGTLYSNHLKFQELVPVVRFLNMSTAGTRT